MQFGPKTLAWLALTFAMFNESKLFSQAPSFTEIRQTRKSNGEIDFSKFDFLKTELADVDIILLGEPSHHPQYYEIKIQLVKYLHEQMGFDVLAFESGVYSMETTNRDIKNGKDIAISFENGLFPKWTSSEDFQRIYRYLDSLRSLNNRMDVTGFDCQVSGYNASGRFVNDLKEALASKRIIIDRKPLDILQAQFENLETGRKGLTDDFNDQSFEELRKLLQTLQQFPDLKVYSQSLLTWIGHFSDLYYNKLFEKLQAHKFKSSDSNTRDSLMAENILFLHRELYPGRKIIAWGANAHFANHFEDLDTGYPDFRAFKPMGQYLKKQLGNKLYFLAVTTNNNYPKTVEHELASKNTELAWLSIASSENTNFISCAFGEPAKGNLSRVVDGILYFDSGLSEPVSADGYFLKGKVLNSEDKQGVAFASLSIENTTSGTASGIDGDYFLKIDSATLKGSLKISCIGYKTNFISIRSLWKKGVIYLTPEKHLLKEVMVKGKAPTALEILHQAIEKIPENYLQTPFNMQFYSKWSATDSVANQTYSLESFNSTYYEGYFKTAQKNYRVDQKRENGDYLTKEKTHGMSQWPMWELAFNDLFSREAHYQIATIDRLEEIDPKLSGIDFYEGDTVFVINYNYHVAGTIYISSKNYAIVRHVTTSTYKGNRTRTEIIYKNEGGKYFPYVANGDYHFLSKAKGGRKNFIITNRAVLNRIEPVNVDQFEHNQDLWYPKNAPYNPEWWEKNFKK